MPVQIERNDLLITVRSDNSTIITDVVAWLGGSNSLNGQSPRRRHCSPGWPPSRPAGPVRRGLAAAQHGRDARVLLRREINSESPMWMGFLDQQIEAPARPRSGRSPGIPRPT